MQRPFANGFNLLAGCNYHRTKDDEFYDGVDQYDQKFTLEESNDPRHKFNVAAIANLPYGHGRRWGAGAHPVVDGVLGGWTISGIYQYVSGTFLRFGAMLASGNPRIDNPTLSKWFDTSKFTRIPEYTRRENPKQYEGVTVPTAWSLDMTLAKSLRLKEKASLEIRMEANTAQRAGYYGRQLQYTGRIRW